MSGKAVVTVTDKRTVHTDALDILGRVITDEDQIGRDAIHLAVEPVVAGQTLHAGMEVGRMADGTFGYSNITKTLGIVDPFIRNVVQIGQKFLLVIYPRQITTLRHVWEHPEFGPDVVNPATEPKVPVEKLYHLILADAGYNKINTIKAIRTVTEFGLKESKDLADNIPSFILENVSYLAAENGAKTFAGIATVSIVEANTTTAPAIITIKSLYPVVQEIWTNEKKDAKEWITSFADDLKNSEEYIESEGMTYEEIMKAADNYLQTGECGFLGNSYVYVADWTTFWKKFEILTGKKPKDGEGGNFFSCSC